VTSSVAAVEVNPASSFCQRWSGGQHSWRHTSEGGFDPSRYVVEPIPEASAKGYVVANHYSGSYPAAKLRFGMFHCDREAQLVGVLVLGIPTSTRALSGPFPELEPFVESCELSRLVLADAVPANGETWFIARCFSEAAAAGIRGVVSFADPVPRVVDGRVLHPGHVGTIYQASNAALCGRSTPRTLTLLPDGRVLNDRSKQKVRQQERGHDHVERDLVRLGAPVMRAGQRPADWLAESLRAIGATQLRHRGNWRYCFKVGTAAQRRRTLLAMPAGPYPKGVDLAA